MKFIYLLILFFIEVSFSLAIGFEIPNLNRSPRALLMGDAYTAIADDEYTLFYNPAALGRHKGLSINFINPDASVSNALEDVDRFKDFPKDNAPALAEKILGFPLHLRFGGTPGLKMGNLGFSLMAASTTNIILRNAVHPSLDIEYKLDRGFIIGYAYTFGSGSKQSSKTRNRGRQGNNGGRKTSVGIAVKNMNRQGIFANYDLFGLELLSKISASESDIHSIRKALGYSYGQGWGGDFGVEHTLSTSISQLNFGLSVRDIGDTKFRLTEGSKEVPSQKMSVNTGVAWTQDFFILDYTLSLDFAPLNQSLPFARTVHFGVEVGLPVISGLFGWNGGYISYGLAFNIFLLKLYAGFYGVEIGSEFGQEESKRGLIYLSILDFSFDP